MGKCKCGKSIGYLKYHCEGCKKELAGVKPKKSKGLCSNCQQYWYMINKEKGCWSYKDAKVVIKNVYTRSSQVIPTPQWRLGCFNYNRGG